MFNNVSASNFFNVAHVAAYSNASTLKPPAVNPASKGNANNRGQLHLPSKAIPMSSLVLYTGKGALTRFNGNQIEQPQASSSANKPGQTRCLTCENRRYQDESGDHAVSFKLGGHIDPATSFAVVSAHENQHDRNAEENSDGRELVVSKIRLFGSVCPECGKSYISGGVTETITRAKSQSPIGSLLDAYI